MSDSVTVVDVQECDGCSAFGGGTLEKWTVPLEVIRPHEFAGVEQEDFLTSGLAPRCWDLCGCYI